MSHLSRLQQRASQVLATDTVHVPSPCVSVCAVNPDTGWCEGCLRNITEIAAWGQMDAVAQRKIWQLIQLRLPVVHTQRENPRQG